MSLKSRLSRARKQFRDSGRGGPNIFLRVVHGEKRNAEIVRATCNGRHYTRNAAETLNAFEHRVTRGSTNPSSDSGIVSSQRGVPNCSQDGLTRARAIPEGIGD
jgi:hypothetical protein